MNYFILVGDRRTWNVSLRKKVWGFTEKTKGAWNTSEKGDKVIFYITAPTKKAIGFGILGKKYVDEKIIWPEEKLESKSIWKYKIKFDISHIVDNWSDGVFLPKKIIVNQGRKKIDKEIFKHIINELKKSEK